ncbi:MAG: cysteine-rich CWC family protein [Brachymonas sp.]|nr:cysteine-rich CWC family protein [Brachymonas sp.]
MPQAQDNPANRCPVCQQPNACAATTGEANCWCMEQAPLPQEVRDRLPSKDACLCAACYAVLRKTGDVVNYADKN